MQRCNQDGANELDSRANLLTRKKMYDFLPLFRFSHFYLAPFKFMNQYTEKNTTLSQVNIYLSQVNFVFLSQDENLFESSKNLFGSSIFVFLSQKDFLFESSKKYA